VTDTASLRKLKAQQFSGYRVEPTRSKNWSSFRV